MDQYQVFINIVQIHAGYYTCGQTEMKINFLTAAVALSYIFASNVNAEIPSRFDEFQKRMILNLNNQRGLAILFPTDTQPNDLMSHVKYLTVEKRKLEVNNEAKFDLFMDCMRNCKARLNSDKVAAQNELAQLEGKMEVESAKFVLLRSKKKLANLEKSIATKIKEIEMIREEIEILESFEAYCGKEEPCYQIVECPLPSKAEATKEFKESHFKATNVIGRSARL